MEALDNPTDPKEVELREVDKKTPPEKNNKKGLRMTFFILVFCDFKDLVSHRTSKSMVFVWMVLQK